MKDRKHVAWLYEQFPILVSEGVLPSEVTERLRRHFGEPGESGEKKWAILILGVLGAALIGAGVILLVAHNWDDLSRGTRTVLAFIPLLTAIALAGWVLLRRREREPWREGAATYWALTIGSTLSLVAQIYQIHGDTARFFLTWMLLGLPIVYLMRSNVAACLYFVGATAWAGCTADSYPAGTPLWYWGLLALAMPHMARLWRGQRYQWGSALTGWVLALCLCVGTAFALEGTMRGAWIGMYTGLLAFMYLAGVRWFKEATTGWQSPWQSVGAIGLGVVALILTFGPPWREIQYHGWREVWAPGSVLVVGNLITALLPIAAVCMAGREARAASWNNLDRVMVGLAPLCAVVGYVFAAAGGNELVGRALFNVYLFALGLGLLVAGVRANRLENVNLGLFALSALIIARFFDSDLSFLARGVAFIVVGAGFLTANVMMLRRKGVVR
ncbi:MAG: DUF2157 domain-containing protein [Verrucomicrobiia bacterium]